MHWLELCRKGVKFLWMGKEGGLSHIHWHRDNMIYSREFDEFCIKLSLHFPIDGVGIKVGKARFYFTPGASNLNILYMCHFVIKKYQLIKV